MDGILKRRDIQVDELLTVLLRVADVSKEQARGLDFDYLKEWASLLGVSDLLERALNEVEM